MEVTFTMDKDGGFADVDPVFNGSSPTSWTDLDLSGVVGTRCAVVFLKFTSNQDMNAIAVRQNGDSDDYYSASSEQNAYGICMAHHDNDADLVLMCLTDGNGVIEWITETSRTCQVYVMAFIR